MMSTKQAFNRSLRGDYIDILIRERGTAEKPELKIEIDSRFKQEFVDELKRSVPYTDRVWDEASNRWRVTPEYLACVQALALKHFRHAHLIEGCADTDLHTGNTYSQGGLFSS